MIETFGRPMIERFLREQQLAFLVDQDGDFHVRFAANEELPALTAQLSAQGPDGQVYSVHVTTPSVFAQATRPRLDQFASEWNRTMRWPRAYTAADMHSGVRLVGDANWLLTDGIHWQLFETLSSNALSTSFEMFTKLGANSLTPTSEELEAWLHRAG